MQSKLACQGIRLFKPHFKHTPGGWAVMYSSKVYNPWLHVARECKQHWNKRK